MTFVNKLYVDFIDHRRNTQSFDLVYFTTYFITFQLLTECHLKSQVYKKNVRNTNTTIISPCFWKGFLAKHNELGGGGQYEKIQHNK